MDLQQVLFEELKFEESSNLDKSPSWSGTRNIPNVDAVYKIGNQRIVYFSQMVEIDYKQLVETYKAIWNESEAPLLYVSLPHEIRIYNCYSQPPQEDSDLDNEERLLKRLTEIINIEDAIAKIQKQINHFDRIHLDSETFWNTSDGQKIDRDQRADQLLLRSILAAREQLVHEFRLSNEIAYDLLGRSIFIQYLEDRSFLTEELISEMTSGRYSNHREILGDFDATYTFYSNLSERFGGDIFPVSPQEKELMTKVPTILGAIKNFISGSTYVGNGITQLSLFPFDFRYIPIGFISEIYDAFLENRRSTGSYYTSQALVDFILEETLPTDKITPEMRILDPACGSGVFLVRTYQRLVDAWIQENNQRPNYRTLSNILRHSIYGCDINAAAARIAVFNLYLALLDYLPPKDFNTPEFSLPKLLGKNILPLDFFSDEFSKGIGGRKFDHIVGNPPWGDQSVLTSAALNVIDKHNYAIGGKQVVQVFLMYASVFCKSDVGEIAFLAPTKSTILVKSGTHQQFRDKFIREYNIRLIVNLSAVRHELFGNAISPSSVIFYRPQAPTPQTKFTYCIPKPSPLFKKVGTILVDTSEIKFLSIDEVLDKPFIWKTASWGTHRDISLISRLSQYPSIEKAIKQLELIRGQGFQINGPGKKKPAEWLTGMKYLPTTEIDRYFIEQENLPKIQEKLFYRGSTSRYRELFTMPAVLIRRGTSNRGFTVAFKPSQALAFKDSITAIAGTIEQEDILKWLTVYINSDLVKYYIFMSSVVWAVERDKIIQKEFLQLPFSLPEPDVLHEIVDLFDQITLNIQESKSSASYRVSKEYNSLVKELDTKVFDVFDLSLKERILVEDGINYSIDFFYWSQSKSRKPQNAVSVQQPDVSILTNYVEEFSQSVISLMKFQNEGLNSRIYVNGAPLCVVEFQKTSLNDAGRIETTQSSKELHQILKRLDERLIQQHSASIFMRRHVRIYDADKFYLIRPSENRFWTRAQALADADETLNQWLSASKTLQKEEA